MSKKNNYNKTRGTICCVVGCFSRGDPGLSFYRFPSRPWESERKEKWINSVRRETFSGEPWEPSKWSRICALHFRGGKKSEDPRLESYNPTIFPAIYQKKQQPVIGKNKRLKRLISKPSKFSSKSSDEEVDDELRTNKNLKNPKTYSKATIDKTTDEPIVPPPISIKEEPEEACGSRMDYDDTSEVLSDNFASEKETDKDIIVGESVVVKEEPTEVIEKEFAEQCLNCTIKYLKQCTKSNVCEEITFLEKLKVKWPLLQ